MTRESISPNPGKSKTHTCTPSEELSAVLINLLQLIINHSQLYGYAWHSNAYIAEHTHCTERTISRRVKALADAGYIAIYYKHGERHIRPLRVYPVSTQCLTINTKPKGYTKENKNVISTEILKEKTETEASADTPMAQSPDSLDAAGCEVGRETSETPGGWAETVDLLIEKSSEAATCSAPRERLSANQDFVTHSTEKAQAYDTAPGTATESIPQQEATPAGLANKETIILSEIGRDNAHHDTSRGKDEFYTGDRSNVGETLSGNRGNGTDTHLQQDGCRRKTSTRMGSESCVSSSAAHGRDTKASGVDTLIVIGVDSAQAAFYASKFDAATIARYALLYRQEAARGKAKSVGWFIRALQGQWSIKQLSVTPDAIRKRQERLRVVEAKSPEWTGAPPPPNLRALARLST